MGSEFFDGRGTSEISACGGMLHREAESPLLSTLQQLMRKPNGE
jgi:hypothetical protein